MKRGTVIVLELIATLFAVVLSIYVGKATFDSDLSDHRWGAFHTSCMFLSVTLVVTGVILFIWELVARGENEPGPLRFFYEEHDELCSSDKTEETKSVNLKKILFVVLGIIFCLWLGTKCVGVKDDCVTLYNTSKIYHNKYNQLTTEKKGFYDKLWKTYLQKEKITNVNKETFLTAARIIMENRADGKSLSWKWVRENQQIPFETYSTFYADLNDFISRQREEYFNLEKACQVIANNNNTMLDTFPNNLYNKLLNCKRIHFEYGFLSDSTNSVFSKKAENLK